MACRERASPRSVYTSQEQFTWVGVQEYFQIGPGVVLASCAAMHSNGSGWHVNQYWGTFIYEAGSAFQKKKTKTTLSVCTNVTVNARCTKHNL